MTTIALCAGAGYAALLWLVAVRVAYVRSIPLGSWPLAIIALCGVTAALIAAAFPRDSAALYSASAIGAIVCATVDARTGLIFDVLSLCMVTVAGLLAFATGHLADGGFAAVIVGGAFLALYLGTRRRGIGLGDVKLASALALGYGVQLSVIAMGSAFIIGAGYAGVLIGTGRARRSDSLRFGPFIAAGAVVGLTAGALGYRL